MENNKIVRTITFKEIIASLKAHMFFIILFTLVISVIGLVYAHVFMKTTYTAKATLQVYIEPDSGNNITETNAYSFGTYLAEDYMKLLTFPEYIENAAQKGVNINPKALKFDHLDKSVLIEITYSLKSKEDASEKVSDDLNKYLEYTKDAIDKGQNSNYANRLRIESRATASTVSVSGGANSASLMAFMLGLVLSILIIIIKFFVDDSFNSNEDVEAATGTAVLSVIGFWGDEKKS